MECGISARKAVQPVAMAFHLHDLRMVIGASEPEAHPRQGNQLEEAQLVSRWFDVQ